MGRTNFAEADVLIDGDRVVEIGPALRDRDAEVVDATSRRYREAYRRITGRDLEIR